MGLRGRQRKGRGCGDLEAGIWGLGACWTEAGGQVCRIEPSSSGQRWLPHPLHRRHPTQSWLSKCFRRGENEEMVPPSEPHLLPFLTFWV